MRYFLIVIFLTFFFVAPVQAESENMRFLNSIMSIVNIFSTSGSNVQLNVTPLPSLPPEVISGKITKAQGAASLRGLLQEIENKTGTPARVLEAVFQVESGTLYYSLTDENVRTYSAPGNTVPNCTRNRCAAAGPMQMTVGFDGNGSTYCDKCESHPCNNEWSTYGKSVQTKGGYSHEPNYCNLTDNIYAAAAKLKAQSGSNGPTWSQEQVFRAIRGYFGAPGCNRDNPKYVFEHLGNRTYCEYVWWYYSLADSTK